MIHCDQEDDRNSDGDSHSHDYNRSSRQVVVEVG